MNGTHHRDLTLCACHLAGVPEDAREQLIEGAGTVDYLADVRCYVPFHDRFPGTWSALCHFQREGDKGYLWAADKSLGLLEELGDAGMHLAGSTVTGTTAPMIAACMAQPGRVLADFHFPSAARMGSYWSTFPTLSIENGRALHLVQDSCLPHHAWGTLLWGHQDFEDAIEDLWDQHREMLKISGSSKPFCDAVRAEMAAIAMTTVECIIKQNAEWSRMWFGQPHRLEECGIDDCLAVCVRAVASSVVALEIMKGQA